MEGDRSFTVKVVHQSSRKTTFFPPRKIVIKLGIKRISAFKEKSFLHQKYVVEGLSINQIVAQTMSSRATVRTNLREFGIQLRAEDSRSGKPGYGEKKINGIIVPNKAELEIVSRIKDLHAQGYSNQKIADLMLSFKIPTKRGGRWNRHTVRGILYAEERKLKRKLARQPDSTSRTASST